MNCNELETYLYTHIPLSKAIGVRVEEASCEKVRLFAPFLNNINHKKTVFGGSLHAVATLACWSVLYLNLPEMPVQIVIVNSQVDYLAPVDGDFYAASSRPEGEKWQRFLKILKAKGRAGIDLSAEIVHKGRLSVSYHARFAAV